LPPSPGPALVIKKLMRIGVMAGCGIWAIARYELNTKSAIAPTTYRNLGIPVLPLQLVSNNYLSLFNLTGIIGRFAPKIVLAPRCKIPNSGAFDGGEI
jgi:hypothetical protein